MWVVVKDQISFGGLPWAKRVHLLSPCSLRIFKIQNVLHFVTFNFSHFPRVKSVVTQSILQNWSGGSHAIVNDSYTGVWSFEISTTFYNFSFHSEWSRWLSDGQGPARRQEEGTRPWQVQVSLPGWLFELTLVGGAYIELCICRTTLRISNQQTSSSREHCWSFKPAAWSAPTYPAFRLAVVQNKLLGPVIYRQIMSFTT